MSEKLPPISDLRRAYGEVGLGDLPLNPMTKFRTWLNDAAGNPYVVEPNAMVLSTIDEEGQVWSRSVLLKGIDEQTGSFTFFTNYGSNKARHIGLDSRAGSTLLSESIDIEHRPAVQGASDLMMNGAGAIGGAGAGVIIAVASYGWLCGLSLIPVAALGAMAFKNR